jgi:hypothetical protein
VTQQTLLDVLGFERLPEQGIVAQIDHADGQIVTGAPPRVDQVQLIIR